MTAPTRGGRRTFPALLALALFATLLAACSSGSGVSGGDEFGAANCGPSDCILVNLAMSPEKNDLLTELAKNFNAEGRRVGEKRVVVSPKSKSSGGATQILLEGWNEAAEGPRPAIWSPAGSAWGAVLDQRLAEQGDAAMAGRGQPFMNTPLVIAMPQPMAEALGWPDVELGWEDVIALVNDPSGWASKGHPEWGPFRLGKTNPNFSTSGLGALIAQNYAATGKTKDLTIEDLSNPTVQAFNADIESAVVHYGDTTLTFLNNWYRADQRGNPFLYASAVAVEEKSVLDYNQGNPDGVLDPGEEPRPPRVPLVAIYPKEGTIFSDNPFFTLDADWVSAEQKEGAKLFTDFVQQQENQQKVLQYGFRPGNPQVAIGPPITAENGLDPDQPQTTLQLPDPPVMVALIDNWNLTRKGARVLVVVDISGSMGETVDGSNTKLDLARTAAGEALASFKGDDLVGLRAFTTGLGGSGADTSVDLVPIGPLDANREAMFRELRDLRPTNGTPLYDVTKSSVSDMLGAYDDTRINAVVVLTDGRNEDGNTIDDSAQLTDLLSFLEEQTQGEVGKPVRVFTIGYGADADLNVLRQIAEATNAAAYTAKDPSTINKVFQQVVSNF